MTPLVLKPAIKWSGSKRTMAPTLHGLWPASVLPTATYFEPFVGGGAMMPGRPCRAGVAGDVLPSLIGLWKAIVSDPDGVARHYAHAWKQRQEHGQAVYYDVRTRFNAHRSPLDLMVLSRMCVNGLIRFNTRREFNNSLHHTRPGIHPDRLQRLLRTWSAALVGMRFTAGDFEITLADAAVGDCVFLDPPYIHNKGRYQPDRFDFARLWRVLADLNDRGVHWIMTLDGAAGARTYDTSTVPSAIWTHRMELGSGNSPFTRLMKISTDAIQEAVFLNFMPAWVSVKPRDV